jgi:hypothetical protein
MGLPRVVGDIHRHISFFAEVFQEKAMALKLRIELKMTSRTELAKFQRLIHLMPNTELSWPALGGSV